LPVRGGVGAGCGGGGRRRRECWQLDRICAEAGIVSWARHSARTGLRFLLLLLLLVLLLRRRDLVGVPAARRGAVIDGVCDGKTRG